LIELRKIAAIDIVYLGPTFIIAKLAAGTLLSSAREYLPSIVVDWSSACIWSV